MRLTELHPRWFTLHGFPAGSEATKSIKIGFTFDCPCAACAQSRGQNRLAVYLSPPIDPGNLLADTTWVTPSPAWKRTGDTFETMTLEPSIDVMAAGHWHGIITNGEAVTA